MEAYSQWEYKVVKDEFSLYFPEGDYDINVLADWYKTIPTHPEVLTYYGDNEELLKQHFEKFSMFSEVRSKITNDLHSNSILYVWCLAIYNSQMELVGFAAQEIKDSCKGEKKILYFKELSSNSKVCYIDWDR